MTRLPILLAVLAAALGAQAPNPFDWTQPLLSLGPAVPGRPESAADVALDRSGNGAVVWRERVSGPAPSDYEIRLQRFRGGLRTGAPILLGTSRDLVTGTRELTVVRTAVGPGGAVAVVWDGSDPTTGWLRPWLAVHVGGRVLGPVPVAAPPGAAGPNEVLPDVAVGRAPGETAVRIEVVWQRDVTQGSQAILWRRFEIGAGPAIVPLGTPLRVDSDPLPPLGGQERPAVARDAAGRVAILWQRFEEWAPAFSYWRTMLRVFDRSRTPIPVRDPSSRGATAGYDFTDYEFSPAGDPAAPSRPATPPRIDFSPTGRLFGAWMRFGGFPFGLRGARIQGGSVVPDPAFVWDPLPGGSFPERFDLAVGAAGQPLVAWEDRLGPSGGTFRLNLSRIDPATTATIDERVIDGRNQLAASAVAVAVADTGTVLTALCRGFGNDNQAVSARPADLNRLALLADTPAPGRDTWRATVPDKAGRLYWIWPMATPAPAGYLALSDGRSADLDLADPVLAWHLALNGPNPLLSGAEGFLDADGAGRAIMDLPPAVRPLNLAAMLLVFDSSRPLPQALELFTQPRRFFFP